MVISPTDFGPAPQGGLEASVVHSAVASKLFGAQGEPVTLGRYAVRRRLGAGRLGIVYAAFDPKLQREVAVKVLRADEDGRQRDELLQEAHTLARIVHPNVVTVHDVGVQGTHVFIAMELVAGATLRQWLGDPHHPREILEMFMQAARGLAAAHRSGVVHGDFKPDNVMVGDDGRVRVLDFGLSWAARVSGSEGPRAAGTPVFMAPEQHRGAEIDGRADQFSWSVALFAALYGQHPFEAPDVDVLQQAIERGPPRMPRVPGVPREVGRVLRRGLAFDREARWPSMDAVIARMEIATRSRRSLKWAAGAAVAGFAALALSGEDEDPCADAQRELVGVWDPERRDAVGSALGAVDMPYAADASAAAVARLDTYAQDWLTHNGQACRADHGGPSVALEHRRHWGACLATRRAELAAVVDILSDADEIVLARANELVSNLEPAARCAEVERLPDPPTIESEVDRAALARVRAEHGAGRPREAIAGAKALVQDASARGEVVVHAHALYELGVATGATGDHGPAADALREAYFGAREVGLEPLAARSAIELAFEIVTAKQSAEDAVDWVRQARVQLDLRGDERLRWRTELVSGVVASSAGKLDDAASHFETCREAALGHALRDVECLRHLGQTRAEQGDVAAGVEAAREVHRVLSGALPESHPRIAGALNDLGVALDSAGRYEEAVEVYEQARRGYAASLGPDNVKVGYALINRAVSQLGAGRGGGSPVIVGGGASDRARGRRRAAPDYGERPDQSRRGLPNDRSSRRSARGDRHRPRDRRQHPDERRLLAAGSGRRAARAGTGSRGPRGGAGGANAAGGELRRRSRGDAGGRHCRGASATRQRRRRRGARGA